MRKLILALMFVSLFGLTSAQAGVSFSVGTGNFYLSVGDYDYLPYSYGNGYGYRPRVSFYSMMSDYGQWVSLSPFGQVWRPYADYGWRPYVHGHWVYTQYGPTWVGYEPWAWAGYHYGNWVFSQQFGWVWIPGYDWHPGRVIWSQGYDTVGWMPAPPQNYDYSRGYLSYRGSVNQFTYNDPDFGYGDNDNYYGDNYYDQGRYQDQYYGDSYSYGGPYYDSRYRDLYYNSSYGNIAPNLWVFIGVNNFNNDNYADCYLDRGYAQNVFNRRLIRISSAPVQRVQLERIVKRKLNEVPVEVKQLDTDKRPVRVVIPKGEEELIRKNANRTVKEVIAPAFAEKQRNFKGLNAKNERELAKVFRQENEKPKFETIDAKEVIKKAQESKQVRDERRLQLVRKEIDTVDKLEKAGKVRQPRVKNEADKERNNQQNQVEEQRNRNSQVEVQQRENQSDNERNRQAERERQLKLEKDQQAEQKRQAEQNRQSEIRMRQDNELRNRQEAEQIRAKREQEFEQQRQQALQKRNSDTQKAEQERMKNLEKQRQFEQQQQINNDRDERLRDTNPNSERMQELRRGNDARSTKPSELENQDRVKNNERDRNANQNDNNKEDRAKKNKKDKNKDRQQNQNPDHDKPGRQK